jgi:hypothetical protein
VSEYFPEVLEGTCSKGSDDPESLHL